MVDQRMIDVARERLRMFEGFDAVLHDPHALLDLVWASRDTADARARIAERYGVADGAADAVLWLQLTRLTEEGRQRIEDEIRSVKAFLDEHA